MSIRLAPVLGKVAKMAERAFTSPRWRLVSAKLKDQLAEAIMSGKTDRVATVLGRITAVEGAKLAAAVGQ